MPAQLSRKRGHSQPGRSGTRIDGWPVTAVLATSIWWVIARSARPWPTRSHCARVPSTRTYSASAARKGLAESRSVTGKESADGVDVGVGSADADAEARGGLRQGVVLAQIHQRDQGSLGRAERATALTLTGDDQRGDPLLSACGRSSAAGPGRQDRRPTRLPGNRERLQLAEPVEEDANDGSGPSVVNDESFAVQDTRVAGCSEGEKSGSCRPVNR
jgi:hypothetical protein